MNIYETYCDNTRLKDRQLEFSEAGPVVAEWKGVIIPPLMGNGTRFVILVVARFFLGTLFVKSPSSY